MFLGHRGHPVGTDSSRGQDDIGGLVLSLVRENTLDSAILFNNVNDLFFCSDFKAFGFDVVCHLRYISGQIVAAQVLLFYQKKVDSKPFGLFSDLSGRIHVGGVNGTVHFKPGKYFFGLVNELLG